MTLYIDGQTYFMHQFSFVIVRFSENKRNHEIGTLLTDVTSRSSIFLTGRESGGKRY